MFSLIIFSFLSGLVTILSPCIWPVLPIIFSFSLSHPGKSRPLGITLGIVVSFTILTLSLSFLVRSFGINPNIFRYLAVAVITFFGLSLIYPSLGQIVESKISLLFSRFPRFSTSTSNNFGSGFVTGLSLGALWTPCAGPILATVVTIAAAGKVNLSVVLITFSYVVGVAIPLFLFSLFGQNIFSRLKFVSGITPKIQRLFGTVMIVTAVLILFNIDTLIQSTALNHLPSFTNTSVNPENNPVVRQQLNTLKGNNSLLTDSSPAPDFAPNNNWLNTPSPLKLSDLKGKVVLVDFWTYTCINCIRTLPHLVSWYDKYKDLGLVIIGVHTPEFEFEKNTANVAAAISRFGIKYPVVQDNNYTIWNSYQNQYWPAEYLIDATGKIRHTHFGEGEYDQTESAIQLLLAESGKNLNLSLENMPDTSPVSAISPESYLGSRRAQYFYPDSNLNQGDHKYNLDPVHPLNSFSLGGGWVISPDNATTQDNSLLSYHFHASKVYLVISPGTNPKSLVNVYLDGNLSTKITVDSEKLYTLFDQSGPPQDHYLKLEFLTPGTQVFAFTFG